ncbi:MAG: tetratricopeptide repeat protein [Saprospiraceae bacterium]|nr:tetratricopeptide repeat protein [Saprospiraceae bacterium]
MKTPFSISIGLLLLFPLPSLRAGEYFSFSHTARDAYHSVISLRFEEGYQRTAHLRKEEPDNLIPVFLDNYTDFLTVLLYDNEGEYKRLSRQMDARLARVAQGDRTSPYYLYIQAEIRLQWAVAHARFNHWLVCMSDIKQAYALLLENKKRFPEFKANLKSLAIIHAMTGSVPEEFRWTLKTFGGIEGSVDQGLREIEEVLAYARTHDYVFEEEALVLYAYMQMYLNNRSDKAWAMLNSGRLNPQSSPLAAYALANLALHTGRNEEAIRLLEQCPSGKGYAPLVHRYFLLGIAKLNRLDADANKPLETFVKSYQGTINLKEAYQKLAWHHLMHGNVSGYWLHISFVKTAGSERVEGDKAALREAQTGEIPDPLLLKARLLFDGGYANRAYSLLEGKQKMFDNELRKSLEYTYRMGRITHAMGRHDEALRYYRNTFERGSEEPWYYACNAALQTGLLYEEKKQYAPAREAFQQCLRIKPREYATSLHNKAKAGLNRLRG